MLRPKVFVDATCIFSKTKRDWLFALTTVSEERMFHLATSEDVLAEAMARLRDKNPSWDGGRVSSIRRNVHAVFDEVLDDFPGDVPFPGQDQGDQHVHAAAVHSGASMLLTDDTGFFDMGDSISDQLSYEVVSPDSLFLLVDDSSPVTVRAAAQMQIYHYESKAQTPALVAHLERAGCPEFAQRVQQRIIQLSSNNARLRV